LFPLLQVLNSRIICSYPFKWVRGSHVSWMGLGKSCHPMRGTQNSFISPFVFHYINEVLRLLTWRRLEGVVTCACCTRFPTFGVLTHTFSNRGLGLLTHRFPTHIIRGSPDLFAFYTPYRIRIPRCTFDDRPIVEVMTTKDKRAMISGLSVAWNEASNVYWVLVCVESVTERTRIPLELWCSFSPEWNNGLFLHERIRLNRILFTETTVEVWPVFE
jgi:hypothetical protein